MIQELAPNTPVSGSQPGEAGEEDSYQNRNEEKERPGARGTGTLQLLSPHPEVTTLPVAQLGLTINSQERIVNPFRTFRYYGRISRREFDSGTQPVRLKLG